jgi:hypothetical protein
MSCGRSLLLYSKDGRSDDAGGVRGLCLRLNMLVRVASSENHKTYR